MQPIKGRHLNGARKIFKSSSYCVDNIINRVERSALKYNISDLDVSGLNIYPSNFFSSQTLCEDVAIMGTMLASHEIRFYYCDQWKQSVWHSY